MWHGGRGEAATSCLLVLPCSSWAQESDFLPVAAPPTPDHSKATFTMQQSLLPVTRGVRGRQTTGTTRVPSMGPELPGRVSVAPAPSVPAPPQCASPDLYPPSDLSHGRVGDGRGRGRGTAAPGLSLRPGCGHQQDVTVRQPGTPPWPCRSTAKAPQHPSEMSLLSRQLASGHATPRAARTGHPGTGRPPAGIARALHVQPGVRPRQGSVPIIRPAQVTVRCAPAEVQLPENSRHGPDRSSL